MLKYLIYQVLIGVIIENPVAILFVFNNITIGLNIFSKKAI